MNFSAVQWVSLVGLDIFARSAYAFAISFNIVLIPVVLFLSILHFFILGLVSAFATPLPLPARRVVTVAVTNVLFATAMAGLWITLDRSSHLTVCTNNICDWIDGTITPSGIWLVSKETGIQILTNLIVTATVILFGQASRTTES
jgi:hypothetical protein